MFSFTCYILLGDYRVPLTRHTFFFLKIILGFYFSPIPSRHPFIRENIIFSLFSFFHLYLFETNHWLSVQAVLCLSNCTVLWEEKMGTVWLLWKRVCDHRNLNQTGCLTSWLNPWMSGAGLLSWSCELYTLLSLLFRHIVPVLGTINLHLTVWVRFSGLRFIILFFESLGFWKY